MKNGSELQKLHKRFGRRAHERAVEFGHPLPDFHTDNVDVAYFQRLQKEKGEAHRKEQEEHRQEQPQEPQQQQTQQKANAPPPFGFFIELPPIQPRLYPPPGPEEQWSQQQASEWQWQRYCCYVQQKLGHEGQEFQNQYPQSQQFYRQYQLQYWHRQQAQYYATLSTLTLPERGDGSSTFGAPDSFVAAPNPGIAPPDHPIALPDLPRDTAAAPAFVPPIARLPATRPSLKRPRSLSPHRGRPEQSVHRSRRPVVPSLALEHLSPGHHIDHARPLAPPLQPRGAVIRSPLPLFTPAATRSEPPTLPATAMPGLAHGLPVPQSSIVSKDIAWPALEEQEFVKMMREQEQRQHQGEGHDYVRKCE